jgi:cbb3-type cytochrome oxidase cytochrome c subunit
MKSGATIFLVAFIALSASWGGFVLAPQLQIGRTGLEKTVPAEVNYPVARSGRAQQGAQVYRSLGCVSCHSQQVRQEGVRCEVILTEAGTNALATVTELAKLSPQLGKPETLIALPKVIAEVADVSAAEPMIKALMTAGAKAVVRVSAIGPDIERGWAMRRSVAQDYANDLPVQIGLRRFGPDLANIGARKPDASWHLRHLYAPVADVKDSTMPPYRFLFQQRKIGNQGTADALQLSGEFAAPAGYEIVPTDEARALAAYLVSLRSDAPLFEGPYTAPEAPAPSTNTPASTNKVVATIAR